MKSQFTSLLGGKLVFLANVFVLCAQGCNPTDAPEAPPAEAGKEMEDACRPSSCNADAAVDRLAPPDSAHDTSMAVETGNEVGADVTNDQRTADSSPDGADAPNADGSTAPVDASDGATGDGATDGPVIAPPVNGPGCGGCFANEAPKDN